LEDIDSITSLVERIFTSYTNHYTSNPYLNPGDIVDGYKEWAYSFILVDNNNKNAWIIESNHEDIGFAACSYDQQTVTLVLSGVIPDVSGNGIFTNITRFCQQYFKDLGCSKMIIPTQIQNFAVQKIWTREGFELSNAHITIHFNSFMNVSAEKAVTIDNFIISPEDIERSREISTTNHIHYSNDYSHELGDNKMAVNGLILNSLFYKYIGTVFPEHGTIILGYSYRFLKPLYADEKYKVVISLPFIDAGKGIYRALIKITDHENNLCLFSYIDLNKK
jgi:hypothetical protein